MDLKEFHEVFYNYLNAKSKVNDVMKIVSLEANNEKWFQGEMVLAFSNEKSEYLQQPFAIFPTEIYNSVEIDDLSWDKWDGFVEKWKFVTIEGDVYGKETETSGIRKVDFILYDKSNTIFSEIKILCFSDELENIENDNSSNILESIFYKKLSNNNVLMDAVRLKKDVLPEFKRNNHNIALSLFLTIICIVDYKKKRVESILKKQIAIAINAIFDNQHYLISENHICINKLNTDDSRYVQIRSEIKDDNKYNNHIYLTTVQLP